MTELLKLVVVMAVAFAAYQIFVNDGLIKNTGTLTLGGASSEEEHMAEHATQEQGNPADKRVVNGQLQDIPSRDEIYKNNPNVLPHPQMSNSFSPQGNFESNPNHNFAQLDCFPKDQLVPQDLMPREGGFAESNPAPQGSLSNRNFFESGYHGGLNTQGNTKKNGNRQLRSDPLIPRRDVGPWQQSTYEADTNRRQFEIGGV